MKNVKCSRSELLAEIDSLESRLEKALRTIAHPAQTETKLIDSENLYRAVGESIDYGVWVCAPDGRNIYASESFLRLVGLTQEQCSDFGWGEVLHPDDAERTILAWKECIQTEGVWDIEHRFRGVDGQWHPILARGVPVRNKKGELVCWAGINLDISRLKRAEEAARKNEERLRLALDAAHLATWDWHIPTGTVIWNSEHYRMLGYEADSFAPTYGHWADRVHPDDLAMAEAGIRKAMERGTDYEAEFRVILPDGAVNTVEALGRFERDAAGCALRLYGTMRNVTERKQLVDELVRINEHLEQRVAERTAELHDLNAYNRTVIEASLDPLVMIDVEGRISDVNSATEQATGCPRRELIGSDFCDYFTDAQKARDGYRRVFRDGLVRDYPLEIRHRDGQITPVMYNATVYHDKYGKVRGVCAAARDVTKLKQAEIEREQFYKFFQTSTDLMVIADPNGAFLKTNPACSEFLGYSARELVSKPFIDFVHPDDRQKTLDEMARQQKIGFSSAFENRYLHKDGSFSWLSWHAVYSRDEDRTYATARDISFDKQQEEALRKSELEFRMLAESMPQIVWITCPDGKNIYFNQQWVDYTGLTLEQSYGDGWNKPFHPDDQQVAWEAWQHATKNRARYSLECRLRRVDGVYKWWLVRGVPVVDEEGAVVKWFGTCTDIDEVKKAEAERLALEQRMQQTQKLESLGILAGGIAHDFNNILTAIIGNASLALMKLNNDSPVTTNLQQIEKAAERAADLARQMLAYSGKGKFLVEYLDLNRLLEEMLHMLEVSVSKKAVLRLNLTPDLPAVEVDATQMRQVIMNLVINASEALGDEPGFINIKSGCRQCRRDYLKDVWLDENISEGLYVYLEISDTGCGMDEDTLGKIFDPFFTTKFTGRGLGMAAVLGIIRGHKGAIKVYSEPGKGTTFRVFLPATNRSVEVVSVETANDEWKGSGTVLLVDDEEIVRKIGAEMLGMLGFKVVTACDGLEAVKIFETRDDIALVILDLTMPIMDGEQCFLELRRIRPQIKVLISSGFSEQVVSRRFAGRDLAGCILKPYSLSALRETLKKVQA
jgi:two-component system, cell cycle sensor histidine kinase and response regulator CckA